MSFHVTHRLGSMERVPHSAFLDLLQKLEASPEEDECASVSVTHESEWCLGAYRGGYQTRLSLKCVGSFTSTVADGGQGIVTRGQILRRALFRYWRRGEGVGSGAI